MEVDSDLFEPLNIGLLSISGDCDHKSFGVLRHSPKLTRYLESIYVWKTDIQKDYVHTKGRSNFDGMLSFVNDDRFATQLFEKKYH